MLTVCQSYILTDRHTRVPEIRKDAQLQPTEHAGVASWGIEFYRPAKHRASAHASKTCSQYRSCHFLPLGKCLLSSGANHLSLPHFHQKHLGSSNFTVPNLLVDQSPSLAIVTRQRKIILAQLHITRPLLSLALVASHPSFRPGPLPCGDHFARVPTSLWQTLSRLIVGCFPVSLQVVRPSLTPQHQLFDDGHLEPA